MRLARIMHCAAVAFVASTAHSTAQQMSEPVDVELILAVDVSLSMSPDELEIQRRGYAEALSHPQVIQAIEDGVHGRIAITYFEWAGQASQRVVVPWTLVANAEDARAFATRLSAGPSNSARRTSLSAALDFSIDLFAESSFQGMKRVVDISGDGPNNQGGPIIEARDRLVEQGVTINGLPLMTDGGLTTSFDVSDLDNYYSRCVIGGPGAFMVPVNGWEQFPEAIRRKLVLELAEAEPRATQGLPIILAQVETGYDCMIGEKLWQNRQWNWGVP